MPGRPIHKFKADMALADMSAADLNEIVRVVESVREMRGVDGVNVSVDFGGISVSLAPELRQGLSMQTVAVVDVPNPAETKFVRVRPVQFRTIPPTPSRANCADGSDPGCTYEWAGPAFDAYPDFGSTPAEYVGYLWQGTEPQLETPFLRVRRENVWILDRPERPIRHVVIVEVPSDGANWLWVRDVALVWESGVWTGDFEAKGERWRCATHPLSVAGDYRGFVWTGDFTAATPILKAYRESWGWWISQYIRWEIPEVGPIIFNDCTPRLAAEG